MFILGLIVQQLLWFIYTSYYFRFTTLGILNMLPSWVCVNTFFIFTTNRWKLKEKKKEINIQWKCMPLILNQMILTFKKQLHFHQLKNLGHYSLSIFYCTIISSPSPLTSPLFKLQLCLSYNFWYCSICPMLFVFFYLIFLCVIQIHNSILLSLTSVVFLMWPIYD